MPRTNRKSAMKVVDGTVRKKSKWSVDRADHHAHVQRERLARRARRGLRRGVRAGDDARGVWPDYVRRFAV